MRYSFVKMLIFIGLIVFLPLLAGTQTVHAANKKVLIIAPHEDDEAIACAGVIKRAVENDDEIKILMVTTGDYGDPQVRAQRMLNALSLLGLSSGNVIYLGYGDYEVLGPAYLSKNDPTAVFPGFYDSQTYGLPAYGILDYHYLHYGSHAPYTRENIQNDMFEAILENLPDEIYMPSPMEWHRDHSSVSLWAMEAILRVKGMLDYAPTLHEYMIYKDGLPQNNLNALEPCADYDANMDDTPYPWAKRESVPVPVEMYDTIDSGRNLKGLVFNAYETDVEYRYYHIKSDEVFWKKQLSSLSYHAAVTASSESSETGQFCKNVIDGVVIGYPYQNDFYELYDKEWASASELSGAWIQLSWPNPVRANRIVLYDRPNPDDQVISGTLTFSDGSSLPIGSLPNRGGGYFIDFETKIFDWVRLTIDEAIGCNIGLAEFEVYDKTANIAPESTVNISSHCTGTSQLGSKATDGVKSGYPADFTKEWATEGQTDGAWIKLSWQQDCAISKIVLYDRPNEADHIIAGTLTLSNGSSIAVDSLPNDGSAKILYLSETQVVNWVMFSVDEAAGENIGLSEFEVFGYPLEMSYTNIAPLSRVTASSEEKIEALQQAVKAVDRRKSGYQYDRNAEWASVGEGAGAWIQLDWERSYRINKVALYDRPNREDHITQATLVFSDGSSMEVGELPNNGEGKVIGFSDRTVRWVRLIINSSEGSNVGLSELEIYGTHAD